MIEVIKEVLILIGTVLGIVKTYLEIKADLKDKKKKRSSEDERNSK